MPISNKNIDKDKKSLIVNIFLSKYISLALGLIFILITILLWKSAETDSLVNLSKNIVSTSNIYASKIEDRLVNIEFALDEIVESSPPYTLTEEIDWDIQADFYIQNFKGIGSIVWIDRNLIIRRVISAENSKYEINEEITSVRKESDEMDLIIPIYTEDIIDGFILGNINIPELILSVDFDNDNHYMVQIFDENGLVMSSANWSQPEKNISVKKDLYFNNKSFSFILTPTEELINLSTNNSYKILIYGLFVSVAISMLILVLQIFREKSLLLLQTQKVLIDKQTELEKKNILLEIQLRDQQKLKSIGLLASGIAHEINNPIMGIMNYSQIIFDSSKVNSQNASYAEEIMNETKRVSNLVQNLLRFSRQGNGNYSIARAEDIISHTVSLMNIIFKKDQINLQVDFAENLPDIKCNSQQIQQVLMNLLTNARDALNEKYAAYDKNKKILVSCAEIVKDDIRNLRITVEDHGAGMPIDAQGKIFNPFYTTKEINKGTGLGLYISIEIIKEHIGELSFETEEGNYTKFYLDLPIINIENL